MALHSSSSRPADLTKAYSLSLLSEYASTLDSLPLELSRHFADLRELDAVLSSSITMVTEKIQRLTLMIENRSIPTEERLWLLNEIADEAGRLKLGGEDKIRVACQAADNLKSHSSHLNVLVESIPSFDPSVLNRKTTYPHVATKSYVPAFMLEPGRRRKAGFGSLIVSAQESGSVKRKKIAHDEESSVMRSPRKERGPDASTHRSRNGNRSRRVDRGASPAESMVSVISYAGARFVPMDGDDLQAPMSRNGGRTTNRPSRTSAASSVVPVQELDTSLDRSAALMPHMGMFNTAPTSSASHPSLPLPYGSAAAVVPLFGLTDPFPPPTLLAGPGIPVAGISSHSEIPVSAPAMVAVSDELPFSAPPDTTTEGDAAEVDGDDRTYCFCESVSYGEMIACDDETCEREWFHLACIGLTVPPEGTWFCETCRTRRAKRGNRGGKRRSSNNKNGGKVLYTDP